MLKLVAQTEVVPLLELAEKFHAVARTRKNSTKVRIEAAVIAGCIEYFIIENNAEAIRVELESGSALQ